MTQLTNSLNRHDLASWFLMAVGLVFVLFFHLLPALLAGLLVYELVDVLAPYIERKIPGYRAKVMALGLLVAIIVSLLTFAGAGILAFFRSDSGSLTTLLSQMAQILEDSRDILPAWMLEHMPADAIAFKEQVTVWLRENASLLPQLGKEAGRVFAHIILGMVVGGIVALDTVKEERYQPFAQAMVERANILSNSFRRVVFAQVRIAAINAVFTGLYLAVLLPMLGIHLPLIKTLIAVTFILGLIPVAGNLMSNTVIVIVSLNHSTAVAIGSLIFLIVIHKLEYFLNARIIGDQIRARAWELLVAMMMMEAVFGIAGVVAAPIYYAYVKSELRTRALI